MNVQGKKGSDNLEKKTIKGIFWTGLEFMGRQGIMFIIQVLLARLLLPSDFGLIGMLTIFIAIANALLDSGFQNWLLRKTNPSYEEFSTVFFFNLLSALFLYALMYIIAPAVANFYQQDILAPMLRVMGLILIFNALAIVQRTQLSIKLDFKTQTLITTISTIFSGVISIYLAYQNFGVWSLVFQQVLNQLVQTILFILINHWIPKLYFNWSIFKEMFDFGWKIALSTILDVATTNFVSVLIGKYFSATDLGYYTNAVKLRDVAAMSVSGSVQKVSFPVLSKIKGDKQRLHNNFRKLIQLTSFFTIPIMLGLFSCSNEIFQILFGNQWMNAVPYFKILCLVGILYPLHALNLNLLYIAGRTDIFLKLEIIKKSLYVLIILIALLSTHSILFLVWSNAFAEIISLYINTFYSKEFANYPLINQLNDIKKSFFSGVIMSVGISLIGYFFTATNLQMLLVKIFVGVVIYISMSLLINKNDFNLLFNIMKRTRNKTNTSIKERAK